MSNAVAESTRLDLPDPGFRAEIADLTDTKFFAERLIPARSFAEDNGKPVLGNALDDPVLSATRLAEVDWATLHAYMHRRFGLPHLPCDPYKDLSAGWMLTTPDPGVFVRVQPSLSGPGFCFTAYALYDGDPLSREARNLPLDRAKAVAVAYRATLVDLLRPVCVRDSWFNAMGEIDDRDDLLAYDDTKDEHIHAVRYHASAGYPMPLGLFGGGGWAKLCSLIREAGGGDYGTGRTVAIRALREAFFKNRVQPQTTAVRVLVASQVLSRPELLNPLCLTPGEVEFAKSVAAALNGNRDHAAYLVDFTEEHIETANKILRVLHVHAGLTHLFSNHRYRQRMDGAWLKLCEACTGDFPDSIDLSSVPWMNEVELAQLPTKFEAAGRPALVEWCRELLAEQDGERILVDILAFVDRERPSAPEREVANEGPTAQPAP